MATLRRLREGRSKNSHTDELPGAAAALFAEYHDDIVGFAIDILGINPWSRQIEILKAVVEHPKTAVRSGHKIGKSTSSAIIALWWFATRPRAFVILTSSGDKQIKEILWPEISRLYRAAKKKLGGTLYDTHHSGLRAEDQRRIIGISTKRTENMGGFSGAELLFVGDEASGIEEQIFRAIEGNLAGGGRFILFGNPTRQSGTFFDAFHSKAEFWHPIHVSSTETPNCTGDGDPIPGLATPEWVATMHAEHGGPGNSEYDIRVDGNFPTDGKNNVIGSGLVDKAFKDWLAPTKDAGELEFGVDVARYGDDETVICPRRGLITFPLVVLKSMDTIEIAGKVLILTRELRIQDESSPTGWERPRVKVDGTGGWGGGVVDNLKRSEEVRVAEVNVSTSATSEKYFRLRDQLWFAARDWLKEGGKMQQDAKLRAELIAPTYHVEARGQLRVSSKDEMKEELGRSPDRADALCLAVYNPPEPHVGTIFVDWMNR